MISSLVSRISATVLLVAGLAMLFAPDVVLPHLVPSFSPDAVWLAQLLAAAWLGVGSLNWLQRGAMLGGIYSRPTVLANLVLYFVSALSVLRAWLGRGGNPSLVVVFVVTAALAFAYAALLLRGPFDGRVSAEATRA